MKEYLTHPVFWVSVVVVAIVVNWLYKTFMKGKGKLV